MNSIQKSIKYFAMGLAILLALGIIGGITTIIYGIYHMIDRKLSPTEMTVCEQVAVCETTALTYEMTEEIDFSFDTLSELDTYFIENTDLVNFSRIYDDINFISINMNSGNIIIQPGGDFTLIAENMPHDFYCENNDGTLIVDTSSSDFFNSFQKKGTKSKLVLTVPENFYTDCIDIKNGAGTILIEGVNTDSLYLSTGACKTRLSGVSAEDVIIEGGVGVSEFEECTFRDADITCGVGVINYEGTFYGDCTISGGVGKSDFNLNNSYKDFMVDISTGLGHTSVNGKNYNSDTTLNEEADNYLYISGGVGNISVKFAD